MKIKVFNPHTNGYLQLPPILTDFLAISIKIYHLFVISLFLGKLFPPFNWTPVQKYCDCKFISVSQFAWSICILEKDGLGRFGWWFKVWVVWMFQIWVDRWIWPMFTCCDRRSPTTTLFKMLIKFHKPLPLPTIKAWWFMGDKFLYRSEEKNFTVMTPIAALL